MRLIVKVLLIIVGLFILWACVSTAIAPITWNLRGQLATPTAVAPPKPDLTVIPPTKDWEKRFDELTGNAPRTPTPRIPSYSN